MDSKYLSPGTQLGQSRYGNAQGTKEDIDQEHRIEARIMNPGDVDEAIWEKAKKVAAESGGHDRWALTSYLYKKLGGKFHKKP